MLQYVIQSLQKEDIMSKLEKYAWVNLGIFTLATILFAVAIPHIGVLPATGCFGICGFAALSNLFLRKGKTGIKLDERELTIQRQAYINGIASAFFFLILMLILSDLFFWKKIMTILPHILPRIVVGSIAIYILVESITILVLSKRGTLHG